ncbi:MAG: TPM domain-containing protein, partial [bacterium]
MRRGIFFLLPFLILLSFAVQYPAPVGFVNDFAGVVDDESKSKMEKIIDFVKEETGAEIAVVTINNLEGESVEMFANELFNKWGIGKKNEDNGVLILIALEERKIRIEVGYGLEPVLTDGMCGEIIRKDMVPLLREEKYGEALLRATQRVADIITTKYKVSLPEELKPPSLTPDLFNTLSFLAFLFFFCFPLGFLSLGIAYKKAGLMEGIRTVLFFFIICLILVGFFFSAVLMPLSEGKPLNFNALIMLGLFYFFIILSIILIFRSLPARRTKGRG